MKKQFVLLACALFSVGAIAEPQQVSVKISNGFSEATVTTMMGEPTVFLQKDEGKSSTCTFKSAFDSTVELTSKPGSPGWDASIFPVEGDAYGVKLFLDVSKTTSADSALASITKDCQLPVGVTSTVRTGKLDTYKWDKPTKLKFADGSFVTVTVSKPVINEAASL